MSLYIRCDKRPDKAFIHVDVCDRCKKKKKCRVFPAWLEEQIEKFDEELYVNVSTDA